MTAVERTEFRTVPRLHIRAFWAIHRGVVRITRGRLGLWRPRNGKRFGVLALTTTGRRSGESRTVMVGYVEDGANLATLAMNGWADKEPAWWLNLQADPGAVVMAVDGRKAVRARVATADEGPRIRATMDDHPGWGDDVDSLAADRRIETPIVVFEPVEPTSAERRRKERVTRRGVLRMTALAALVAGILFVVIQPMHPADSLEAVTTSRWALVHYLTLVMTVLFGVGITGIYARQVRETGWLGLIGVVALDVALVITGAVVFVEAFISPVLALSDPGFVDGMLAMVSGREVAVDLGALPAVWAVSGVLFPGGCLLFGIAAMRARVLPRLAAAVFGFGLPVAVVVVAMLPGDLHRFGAIPVGIGLAGMGWALFVENRRATATSR